MNMVVERRIFRIVRAEAKHETFRLRTVGPIRAIIDDQLEISLSSTCHSDSIPLSQRRYILWAYALANLC